MTEPEPNLPADHADRPEPSAFVRAVSEIWRVIQPTFAKVAAIGVGTLVLLLALTLAAPEKIRERVSRVQYALLSWSLPNELPGGLIRVTAPRVFTRERLVNDRFDEADWLQRRLQASEQLLTDEKFAKPDQIRVEWDEMAAAERNGRNDVTAATEKTRNGIRPPELSADQPELALSPQQQLERANRYRDSLRRRLMSENLDDTHDIEGNTLYRLDLAAAITPPPYSDAVAVVELQVNEQGREFALASYGELLEEWRDEIERHSIRLYTDRMRILRESDRIPIDQASRELKLEFYEYSLDKLADLMSLGTDGRASAKEILSLNRQVFMAFEEEQIRDSIKNRLRDYYPDSDFRFQLGAYRFFCQQDAGTLKSNSIEALLGPSARQLDLEVRCIELPSGWETKADLELLHSLHTVEEFAGKGQAKACFEHLKMENLLSFPGTNWPPYKYLYRLSEVDNDCFYSDATYKSLERIESFSSSWDKVGIEVARYIWHTIDGTFSKNLERIELKDYFDLSLDECSSTNCSLKITVIETNNEDQRKQLAGTLMESLNTGARALSYSFTPDQDLVYADGWSGHALVVQVDQFGRTLTQRSEAATHGIAAKSGIVGFGDWGREVLPANGPQTKFGWLVFSGADNLAAGSPAPRHVSLSALVSLPSWWRKIEMTVTTCWLPRVRLLSQGITHHCSPAAVDNLDKEDVVDNSTDRKAKEQNTAAQQRMYLHLPGTATDISQRLMFEVVKYPFVNITSEAELQVEMGRDARLAISGGRLWKSPRVQLGHQWADRVQVLPDMNGIIAEFNCIEPPLDYSMLSRAPANGREGAAANAGDSGSNGGRLRRGSDLLTSLRIWTSEGVTQPMPVKVFEFQERYTTEKACVHWLQKPSAPEDKVAAPEQEVTTPEVSNISNAQN